MRLPRKHCEYDPHNASGQFPLLVHDVSIPSMLFNGRNCGYMNHRMATLRASLRRAFLNRL